MASRFVVILAGFAAVASVLPAAADDGNSVSAGDNLVDLPDESADDEALGKEAAKTTAGAGGGIDGLPPLPSGDAVGSPSLTDSGGFSSYSGGDTGIAISTVNAEISNNDFHN